MDLAHLKVSRNIIVSLMLLVSGNVFSQQTTDTVALAVELQGKAMYGEQYKILAQYRKSHPADVNVEWLFGQATFHTNHVSEMKDVYRANISAHPDNYYLAVDYAFKLLAVGELKESRHLLEGFITTDTANPQIYASLAQIEYWESNYHEALAYITKALIIAPATPEYLQLKDAIWLALAPWIGLRAMSDKDNQPLQVFTTTAEGGMYVNRFLSPTVSAVYQSIDTSSRIGAQRFAVANRTVLPQLGCVVRTQAGIFAYPNGTTKFVGLVGVDKSLFKVLTLSAQIERKPYIMMRSSLDTSLSTNDITLSAKYEKEHGFIGQVAYTSSMFDDDNSIATSSAWFVTPPLDLWKLSLRAGYGYSRTDSEKDTYTPIRSQEDLLYDIYFDPNVAGYFTPYLTPTDQKIHSLIGVIGFNPTKQLNITFSGSYGFAASIEKPYMYGYYSSEGDVVVEKQFYTEKYTSLDLSARASMVFSRRWSANLSYNYSLPNYYYDNTNIAFGVKMILLHD